MITARVFSVVALTVALMVPAIAKDKNTTLPDSVLRATTVYVVISPDAGQSLNHPMDNANAREQVAEALRAWGRFNVVEGDDADLVIAVRAGTGQIVSPTVENGPTDNRVSVRPGDGRLGIEASQGRGPALSDPTLTPQQSGPHIGKEVGRDKDSFEVFKGGAAYSQHSTPLWRYTAKNALKAPTVPAVEQFRKAVAASEKAQKKH